VGQQGLEPVPIAGLVLGDDDGDGHDASLLRSRVDVTRMVMRRRGERRDTILVNVRTSVPFLILALLIGGPAPAHAAQRLVRTFGTDDALPVPFIKTLVQDAEGFLWIGTGAGLVRYDGREMVPWGLDVMDQEVPSLAASADGDVVCTSWDGHVFEVARVGLRRIAPPAGFGAKARGVEFDRDGALVVSTDDGLHRRVAGEWQTLARPEPARRTLILGGDGPLFAATEEHAWRRVDGAWEQLGKIDGFPIQAARAPDGRVVVLTFRGAVLPFSDHREAAIEPARPGRGIGIAFRGGTMWVSADRHLTAYRVGERPEVLDNRHGVWSGGPMLVDREGSLWHGSNTGLHQYPEPETRAYSDLDGLPSAHSRFLVESNGRVVVSTWQGAGEIEGAAMDRVNDYRVNSRICEDSAGRVWGMGYLPDGDTAWVAWGPNRQERHPTTRQTTWVAGCAPSAEGTVWLTDGHGVWESTPDRTPPVLRSERPDAFGDEVRDQNVVLRRDGRLVVTAGAIACQARADDVRRGEPTWRCSELVGQRSFGGLAEASDGRLWAAAVPGGVFRETDAGWERLEATDTLPSPWLNNVRTSGRGGMWLMGHGNLLRVADEGRPGAAFEVLERIGRWQGLVGQSPRDIVEGADGTLWVATERGVERIPRTVARSDLPVPDAHLASARIDGRAVDVGAAADAPAGAAIDLRFAALSYRDPGRVQYRFRAGPGKPWSPPRTRPELLLLEPAAGGHVVEVAASLDGRRWSPSPARFEFTARPPWFRDLRFVVAVAALLLLALAGAWQVRVRQLLRVERLRTGVAMDLHDEVGSGLGSIGLLAEAAALAPAEAREGILERIADSSTQLGRSLTAIVWSLRTQSSDLRSLGARLAERGGAMFPGTRPELAVEIDDLPAAPMDVAVVRTVLLVGLEAMHNAAKHAEASRVVLGLRRAGPRWKLVVEDDGRGLDAAAASTSNGYGVEGMRRRAAEGGADLEIGPAPAGGTRVELRFRLKLR